jgi:hypothetical protein
MAYARPHPPPIAPHLFIVRIGAEPPGRRRWLI